MSRPDYSWNFNANGTSNKIFLILLFLVSLLSATCYWLFPTLPICLLPMLGFGAWTVLPRLGAKADQIILLGILGLCFILDDVGYAPWGTVQVFTEILGIVLFKNFGMNGLELFVLGFTGLLLIITSKEEKQLWRSLHLLELLAISSLVLITVMVGGVIGIGSGGSPLTFIIQARNLYLLPLWTFIGFCVLRNTSIMQRLIFCFTTVIVLKSLQTIILYAINRSYFQDAEYVYEHFFSAYAAVSLVSLFSYFIKYPALPLRLLTSASFFIVLLAYVLNDRRTSYVAVILSFICLLGFLPKSVMINYGRKIFMLAGGVALLLALTWNLPGPFGLAGSLYRSFGQESAEEGPSYRDLENANMLQEVSKFPLTGKGYGKEFEELYPMPSVALIYPRYKMIPHNNLLAAWCYGGPLGISALSLLFITMIALAGRMIIDENLREYRFIGLFSLFYFIQYFAYTFGDLGLQANRNLMLGGLLFGGCFRLMVQKKKGFEIC